jgi:RNA polymerase sigma-70 factor (ECF subfamily)
MTSDPLADPPQVIRRVYAYVAYRIGPRADAEDVVSETIERALRYRDSYDERKGPPMAWLTAIASHVIADRSRALSTEPERGLELETSGDDFSDRAAWRLDLQEALALVDDRTRELLALRYGADLKVREIAQLLGWRTNTVEVALHRALARLREILEQGPPASNRREAPPHVLGSDG